MAKGKKKYACKTAACRAQRKRFGTVAKAANAVCHRETNSVTLYKKCMSTNMKAGLKKAGVTGKKKSKAIKCTGLFKSGPKRGQLKPGYTRAGVKKGNCPRKKKS